jgi:DNA-binding SARP family transcriptional activator
MHDTAAGAIPLRATFLGRTRVDVGGHRIESRLSADTLVLLAMILIQCGDELARDELAFTLWPDAGEADARAALRRHLYVLRRTLPPGCQALRCEQKSVSWDASHSDLSVDVLRFERLSADSAEVALELYTGDFLPYHDHEWVVAKRERLREHACSLFLRSLRDRATAASLHQRLRYAERLLVLDPWREDVLRETLHLRCLVGDRAGAVATYRRFRDRLNAELSIEPMPETVRCYDRLVRGEIRDLSSEHLSYEPLATYCI